MRVAKQVNKRVQIREIFPMRLANQVNKRVRMHIICRSRASSSRILNYRYINLYIKFVKLAVFTFLTSENDVICTVTLHHLSRLWCAVVL